VAGGQIGGGRSLGGAAFSQGERAMMDGCFAPGSLRLHTFRLGCAHNAPEPLGRVMGEAKAADGLRMGRGRTIYRPRRRSGCR